MANEKAKILYVDDEQINLEIFKLNFSKKYEVHTALNGNEGLEILNETPEILVVVSDMRMPQMNGIEFILKAQDKFPSIKYFILTGFDLTDEIEGALDTGLIKAYFRKPFNINEIDTEINKVLV